MPENVVQRPRRWDKPFDADMQDQDVERVLSGPHFVEMQHDNFPSASSLREIIKNDCRLRHFAKDELIVHAGAYLNSAFLILSGRATLVLPPGIDPSAWGQTKTRKPTAFTALIRWLRRNRLPEVRRSASAHPGFTTGASNRTTAAPLITDLDQRATKAGAETIELGSGDLFGESAVLGRNVMSNTVVAQQDTLVLEIRWQGLRDICKREPQFKEFVDRLYRERGLYDRLLAVPLLQHINREKIRELANIALFEVHGEFEWQRDFQKASKQAKTEEDYNHLIEIEPLIAQEGDYPDGLLLIANGFARVSRRINYGHYTLGHLATGSLFGLQELYDSWQKGKAQQLACSLRALGYTDVIRIPSQWLEQNVFSQQGWVDTELAQGFMGGLNEGAPQVDANKQIPIERKFTEFLVENRFINGTQTMMIDLERCVRCDDCVTACANAHDNNPRFVRHGQSFGRYMIPNACMHCDDPVCMIGCPTGAIHRSNDGVVTINDQTCIGCSTCANSCPYDNIRMVPIRDKNGKLFTDEKSVPITKATKCDLCSESAGGPACERACPHDALTRIDLNDIGKLADWIDR